MEKLFIGKNIRKRGLLWCATVLWSAGVGAQTDGMDSFIDRLMDKMTVREKLGQLNLPVTGNITTGQVQSSDVAGKIREGLVGGLFNLKGADRIREVQELAVRESRLGIPLIFGMDVIHGYETVFPIPLALSCSWDLEAIRTAAALSAREAAADGICWTFSPMVDICRDARWGRMAEGSGEDPFLGAAIARAMVEGYQGAAYDNRHIMACVKHFALYGAAEGGRDYNTVDMSRNRMYNEYFPPYKAAVEAGAASVMTSFNEVDGVPATANKWLITDVLRRQWGFGGFVVTDYTSILEMTTHGLGDLPTVSARALKAGVDMDMVSDGFVGTLEASLAAGKVDMKEIDAACRRMLEAKYRLGLFADPYKYCREKAAKVLYTPEHRAVARKVAAETFVLLKNDSCLLPLPRKGRILLTGPLAHTRTNMAGTWSVAATPDRYRTLLEGMRSAVGSNAEVLYAQGCNLMYSERYQKDASWAGTSIPRGDDAALRAEALALADRADVIVAAMGESAEMSGESSSRAELELPDAQRDLLEALLETGKPVVLLHFAGRPTVMKWERDRVPAILNVWFGGSEAADAICDVLFGDKVPCGKLTATFPQSVGQLPLGYNHKNTGRPVRPSNWYQKYRSNYLDVSNEPVFPFGYGLSYTTFAYGPVELSADRMPLDGGRLTASVTVSNTGRYDADEVVQLYIRDVAGSITRPVKELKGFERIHLKQGEARRVTFEITPNLLRFYDYDLNYVCESGAFRVMIGPNSRDTHEAAFTVE